MNLTIAVITARTDPMLPALLDSLEPQLRDGDAISLLVIDAFDRARADLGCAAPRRLARFDACAPKPNMWQGRHRITSCDFFANANARNTAICECRTDYIAFLDDRATLAPTWLEAVRRGARTRDAMLCGPYDKREDAGWSRDHRRQHAPSGRRDCGGGWAFGGNFCLPLEWLIEVNGCEEGCDPTGLEDCILGLMIGNAGHRIDFEIGMSVQQDRTGPVHPPGFPRLDRGDSPRDRSHAILERFGKRKRTEFTPDLAALRRARQTSTATPGEAFRWPIPNPAIDYRDWFDNELIRNMLPASDCQMSNAQIVKGGLPVPAASRVATDQSSILGDGSIENPLRTNGAGGPTIKVDVNSIGSVHLGTPVCVVGAPSTEGAVCTVTKANGVTTITAAQCIGLIVAFNDDGTCQVQTGGTVTLSTAEWTVVASPSGGLVPSETYYLDAAGLINDSAPGTPGNFSSQVGVALTAESLLLSTPSVPLEVA